MEQFRALLQERTAERGALARLAQVSRIPSPVIGRWRDGIGRPSDKNLKKLAPALGVPYEDLMKMCGYLPGEPSADGLDPQLAAFLAAIEAGWLSMDTPIRDVAERGALALFAVPPAQRRSIGRQDGASTRRKATLRKLSERRANGPNLPDGPDYTVDTRPDSFVPGRSSSRANTLVASIAAL